jgi:hypothetical protein
MANPACTFCEQNEGVMMSTNLTDGDTVIACGACLPGYALGMAAAVTQGMEQHEALQYADALDTIYANDPRAPKSDRLRPRGKTRKTAAPEPPADVAVSYATDTVSLVPPCSECGGETATGDANKLTCDGCGTVIATASESTSEQP